MDNFHSAFPASATHCHAWEFPLRQISDPATDMVFSMPPPGSFNPGHLRGGGGLMPLIVSLQVWVSSCKFGSIPVMVELLQQQPLLIRTRVLGLLSWNCM